MLSSIEIFSSICYWNTGKGKVAIETIHCPFRGPRPPPATKATTRLHLSAINAQTTRKKVAGTQDAPSAIKVTNRTSGATIRMVNFINVFRNGRGRNRQKENIVGARTMQNKVRCIYVRRLRRWNERGHRHRWVYLYNFQFPPLLTHSRTIQNSSRFRTILTSFSLSLRPRIRYLIISTRIKF